MVLGFLVLFVDQRAGQGQSGHAAQVVGVEAVLLEQFAKFLLDVLGIELAKLAKYNLRNRLFDVRQGPGQKVHQGRRALAAQRLKECLAELFGRARTVEGTRSGLGAQRANGIEWLNGLVHRPTWSISRVL